MLYILALIQCWDYFFDSFDWSVAFGFHVMTGNCSEIPFMPRHIFAIILIVKLDDNYKLLDYNIPSDEKSNIS